MQNIHKFILGLIIVVGLLVSVSAIGLTTRYNPWTGKLDYISNGNFSGINITADGFNLNDTIILDWTQVPTFNFTYDAKIDTNDSIYIFANQDSWNSTYNLTYNNYAYNMSDGSYNETYDTALQTLGVNNTYNSTYDSWNYNQTTIANNFTLDTNSSTVSWIESTFIKIINFFTQSEITDMIEGNVTEIYSNNESWSSTYNSTYDSNIDTNDSTYIFANEASWNSTFNKTYNDFSYNFSDYTSDSTFNETYDSKNSSYWIKNGDNIHYNLGRVFIGLSEESVYDATFSVNGSSIFNSEKLAGEDFQVNSQALTRAFFVNGTSGYVGVGGIIPERNFHMNGIFLMNNNQELRWKDSAGTQRTLIELTNANDFYLGGSFAGSMVFVGGGSYTERFRIADNGDVKFDTNTMVVDVSTDRVGIGTTSPTYKLDVNAGADQTMGRIYSSNANPSFQIKGTGTNPNPFIAFRNLTSQIGAIGVDNANNMITFGGASINNDYMVIKTDTGRVGIGTASPSYPLTVIGNNSGISIWADGNISASGFITRTKIYDKIKEGKALPKIKDADEFKKLDGSVDHSKYFGYTTWEAQDLSKPENVTEDVEVCEQIPTIEEVCRIENQCGYKLIEGYYQNICNDVNVCEQQQTQTCNSTEEVCNYNEVYENENLLGYERTCETIPSECLLDYTEECHIEQQTRTTYPYTKTEEGVNLEDEINVLRQAVYELKLSNNNLENIFTILQAENQIIKLELCNKDNSYSFCKVTEK